MTSDPRPGSADDIVLERRKLGRTPVEVTALGFGGATIGIDASVPEAQGMRQNWDHWLCRRVSKTA